MLQKIYFFIYLIGILLISLSYIKTQLNNQFTCPIFICSSATAAVNGTCYTNLTGKAISKIIVTECPTNQYCKLGLPNVIPKSSKTSLSCTTIPINVTSKLDIGNLVEYDFCINNTDCASGNCLKNICIGKDIGLNCSNSTECTSLAYCDKSCVIRKNISSSCKNNYECLNNAGCLSGICTGYYSIKAGFNLKSSNSSDYTNDMGKYCFSRWANSNGTCENLTNTGIQPYTCNVTQGCNYTTSITNQTVTLKDNYCSCSYFGDGNAFCMLGTNTTSYINYIQTLLDLMNVGCHFYNKNFCSITDSNLITQLYYSTANVSQQFIGDFKCIVPKSIPVNPALCPSPTCDDTSSLFSYNDTASNSINIGYHIYFQFLFLFINLFC